jgi:hypothetical protein
VGRLALSTWHAAGRPPAPPPRRWAHLDAPTALRLHGRATAGAGRLEAPAARAAPRALLSMEVMVGARERLRSGVCVCGAMCRGGALKGAARGRGRRARAPVARLPIAAAAARTHGGARRGCPSPAPRGPGARRVCADAGRPGSGGLRRRPQGRPETGWPAAPAGGITRPARATARQPPPRVARPAHRAARTVRPPIGGGRRRAGALVRLANSTGFPPIATRRRAPLSTPPLLRR